MKEGLKKERIKGRKKVGSKERPHDRGKNGTEWDRSGFYGRGLRGGEWGGRRMGYGDLGLDLDLDLDLDMGLDMELDFDLDLRPEMAEGKGVVEVKTKRTRGEWGWNRYLPFPSFPFLSLPLLPSLPFLYFPFLPSSSPIVFPSFIL